MSTRPPDVATASFLQSFWSRLAGKFGTKFYWQEKGEAASIMNTVCVLNAAVMYHVTSAHAHPQYPRVCSSGMTCNATGAAAGVSHRHLPEGGAGALKMQQGAGRVW
jgi:hypothetical protein